MLSIAPSGCSVGTKQGFSILSLPLDHLVLKRCLMDFDTIPIIYLAQNDDVTSDWSVYHKDLGATDKYLVLNTTASASAEYLGRVHFHFKHHGFLESNRNNL